jgi:hypothetical protein
MENKMRMKKRNRNSTVYSRKGREETKVTWKSGRIEEEETDGENKEVKE